MRDSCMCSEIGFRAPPYIPSGLSSRLDKSVRFSAFGALTPRIRATVLLSGRSYQRIGDWHHMLLIDRANTLACRPSRREH